VEFQRWGDNIPVSISFGAIADSTEHRREIVERLVANGIETRIFSAGNLGLHPFWVDQYGEFNEKMSDKIHSRGFFVPNYPEMTAEDVDFICSIVRGE
jgi:CDP-6-deoxy-D-xylo-4-hexulose-3-dehydrase